MSGITPGGAQALNMTHMFDFTDLRTCVPSPFRLNDKTISWYIFTNKETSIFKKILIRSGLTDVFSSSQANATLLIPTDSFIRAGLFQNDPEKESIFFDLLDVGSAKDIVNASTLVNYINGDILRANPNSYFTTKNHKMRMYVCNVSGETYINDTIKVVQYDLCLENGFIHLVSDLVMPNGCTFIN